MARKIEVGILGATGMVGQQFALQLADHPWFNVTWLGASQRSEGRRYDEAAPWRLATPMPDAFRGLVIDAAEPTRAPKVIFSGLDSSVAGQIEGAFAEAGHIVISNARNYRMDPVVPLLIPEINADHLALLDAQADAHGWPGRILTNPNCSTVVLSMVLAPLRRFGLRRVMVTTMQAVSGAGYPGVASLDILGNVVPFIDGEEEKMESETKKILGCLRGSAVEPHELTVSAQTTRVPVANGHTEMVSVGFEQRPAVDDLLEALKTFAGLPQQRELPTAPKQPIVYLAERNRPQPALDVHRGGGMTVSVGRVRPCPLFDYKLVALGHNTVRGAAGAAVLNAELMKVEGRLG
ncbi:MAG TPA: aspartate-semialdehyde dehydrogenase [Vicinamibacterales bacterium]|nr:aspartate-semialdehyde dehydrogenase [Vicinamibacterales bacterium]